MFTKIEISKGLKQESISENASIVRTLFDSLPRMSVLVEGISIKQAITYVGKTYLKLKSSEAFWRSTRLSVYMNGPVGPSRDVLSSKPCQEMAFSAFSDKPTDRPSDGLQNELSDRTTDERTHRLYY